jgi:putative peptidoglycan lipid II flippase
MSVDPTLEPAVAAPELEPALASKNAGLARATSVLAIGNVASRLLGFARVILLSHYFGAQNGLVDAFTIAVAIPQDLYDLAISGHVNSALVPVLSEYAVKDQDELWRLVNMILALVMVIVSGMVLLIELLAPQIIYFYRGQADSALSQAAFDLSVNLLRLTAPALIFLGLFAILSGLLYALRRFTWPAFGAALFNGTIVVAMIILAPRIGIQGAAIGWVLAGVTQLALQFGGLSGFRLRLDFRGMLKHPGVRRVGLLYIPVLGSLILDVLINRPFSYNMASQSGQGIIAYMDWATSLREFPMGLVGVAISFAILPTLARIALQPETRQEFKDTLGQGIRLALTLILPAAVGMFVLAGPFVGLIFEHGNFTASDTVVLSNVLRLYLFGIPFAAIDLILIFAFYAVKDTLTPALIGVFSLLCYIGIALILEPRISFYSLMLADSLKHLIHMTICLVLLRRRFGDLGSQRFPITLAKVTLATIVMGLVAYAVEKSAVVLWPVEGLPQRIILAIVPALLAGTAYFILASLLKVNEFTWFVDALRRKIAR